jgi:hypothetical protein
MKRICLVIALFSFFTALQAATDSLTVYVFLSEDCPVCQNQTLPLRELYPQFKSQGVGFVAVFSNPSSVDSTITPYLKQCLQIYFQKSKNKFGTIVPIYLHLYCSRLIKVKRIFFNLKWNDCSKINN